MLNPLQEVIAADLLGLALNLLLSGITWCQFLDYFQTNSDNIVYRCVAAFVFLVGSAHTVFAAHFAWILSISALADPSLYAKIPWSLPTSQFITTCVAAAVQATYAHRIWLISKKSWWLPALILTLTVAAFGFNTAVLYWTVRCDTWACLARTQWSVGAWLGSLTAADVVITSSLIFYLRRTRSAFTETNTIIDRIIRLAVQNNALTSTAALLSAILFACDSQWNAVFGQALIKLYMIAFFSTLNSRRTHFDKATGATSQRHYRPQSGGSPRPEASIEADVSSVIPLLAPPGLTMSL
ncbi:hypothetical protein JCM6882_007473 [Rhodosporidiobolus microsporus]